MTLPYSTTLPVPLRAVIEALEMQNDETSAYLNRHTGELVLLSHEEMSEAEAVPTPEVLAEYPQWQRAAIEKAAEVLARSDYLQLPSKFDLHEWQMMEKYCSACTDEARRERLLATIHGRGAFRRFKAALDESELQEWDRFREAEYARVAVGWLEANGIAYQNDL